MAIILTGSANSLGNLFLFCYFGKLATESYGKMANCLYDGNWQDLVAPLQKYFIVMMADAQRPVHYTGLKMFLKYFYNDNIFCILHIQVSESPF